MQLKSRAAVHLDNEGGSLNMIVCDTENTSLKRIGKTAKVVWQQTSRVDLGDCRCLRNFFSSVWQYLADLPFQLLENISSIYKDFDLFQSRKYIFRCRCFYVFALYQAF